MITRKSFLILVLVLFSGNLFIVNDVCSFRSSAGGKNPMAWLMLLLDEASLPEKKDISVLVDEVDQDNLLNTLAYLTSFDDRNSYEVQEQVLDFISNELDKAGASIRFYEYEYSERTWHNLVATIPGNASIDPSEPHLVVGAHIDTVSGSPGADDNASGVSAIMEAARVLAGSELSMRVDFVFFTLEEVGAIGSRNYAAQAKASGEVIIAMIAVDAVAFGSTDEDLELATKPSMAWIAQDYKAAADKYTTLVTVPYIDETCG
jgi:acetylornithine deacetylase/succinyl-diaminopimelate desuccinylase-like protein